MARFARRTPLLRALRPSVVKPICNSPAEAVGADTPTLAPNDPWAALLDGRTILVEGAGAAAMPALHRIPARVIVE
jgi:hypothetical protein